MLETIFAVAIAAVVMSFYQSFRGGFDYINQLRLEAKANAMTAPLWLWGLMVLAFGTLVTSLIYVWTTHVWLLALALTLGTLMISVSIKVLFLPRSESRFYQRCFGEIE